MTASKQLLTRTRPNAGSMYEIYFEGGGQVPGKLTGLYSSAKAALQAIDMHMTEKEANATVESDAGAEDL